MATEQQLIEGLRKADAAGNAADARAFAGALRKARAGAGAAPMAEEAPEQPEAPKPLTKTSQALGLFEGFHTPMDNAAAWLEGGARKIGIPVDAINRATGMTSAEDARKQNRASVAAEKAKGVQPGFWGSIAGNVAGTLPAMVATRNPWLIGAQMGALNTDKDVPTAMDVAKGAVLGKAGDSAARAVGAVVQPVWRDNVNRLLGEGVRLTPGQIVGGTAKSAEDVLSTVYGIGDVVRGAQRRAEGDFVNAATNRALRPSGRQLAPGTPPGHEGIRAAQGELNQQYDRILQNATVDISTPRSARRFLAPMRQLTGMAQNLPQVYRERFNRVMTDEVAHRFGGIGRMSGQSYKELDEILGKEVKRFSSGNVGPHDRDYADAIRQLQENMRNALSRSSPAHRQALRATDEGYSNLAKVETAAGNARAGQQGRFTPDDLQSAVRQQDTSVRHRRMAGGTARMEDLSEAGGDVLHRTIADGVGNRATVNALIGTALYGTGAGSAMMNPAGLAALAAVTGAYTRRGGDIVRNAMTRRPAGAANVRRGIQAASRAGVPAATTNVLAGKRHGEED